MGVLFYRALLNSRLEFADENCEHQPIAFDQVTQHNMTLTTPLNRVGTASERLTIFTFNSFDDFIQFP